MSPLRRASPDEGSTEILDLLEESARASSVDATEWRAPAFRRWRVPAGEMIIEAGTPVTDVHVVASGTVELRRPADPRRAVISVLRRGGVFGDVPHVLDRVHHVDAVTASDAEFISLRSDRLATMLAESPRLAHAWSVSLAERVFETHARLGELLAGHLDHRVGAVLLRRVDFDGRVDLTQEAMARLLGVQRSSINEVIRRLELRGLIRRGYGHVVVTDRNRLAALVSQ